MDWLALSLLLAAYLGLANGRWAKPHEPGMDVQFWDPARMASWILETGQADLEWKDYEGKSLTAIARGTGKREMVELLRKHGVK